MDYNHFCAPSFFYFLSFINSEGKRVRYTSQHLGMLCYINSYGSSGRFYDLSHVGAVEMGITHSLFLKLRDELLLPSVELGEPLLLKEEWLPPGKDPMVSFRSTPNSQWRFYDWCVFHDKDNHDYRVEWLNQFADEGGV